MNLLNQRRNKFIIITISVLLVIGLVVFIMQLNNKNKETDILPPHVDPSAITGDITDSLIPPEGSLVVNTVGDVLISDSKDVRIMYLAQKERYEIYIFSSRFDAFRTQAEKDFLKLLNIDQDKACKLNVIVMTPEFANPELAGIEYGLSFCEAN